MSSSSSSSKGKKKEDTCDPVECKICCEIFTLQSELHSLGCGHMYLNNDIIIYIYDTLQDIAKNVYVRYWLL